MPTNPLHQAVTDYLEWNRRHQSPATEEQRRFILEAVFLPWADAEGISEPRQVTDRAMERFSDHLSRKQRRGKPLSVQTVRTYLRQVRAFLNKHKVEKGDFRLPRAPERLLEVLTPVEIRAMEDAAHERDLIILRLLIETGIRASELLGLRPSDLHERRGGPYITVIGKGNKQRNVPVPPDTFELLKHYAAMAPGRRFARFESDQVLTDDEFGAGYVFIAKRSRLGKGGRLTVSGLRQVIHHLAKRAGIKRRVWTHQFRHTFATNMLNAGMEPLALAKIMGHADLTMIMRVYSHQTIDDLSRAMMRAMARSTA